MIAILGGTGDLGAGLAHRWLKSGYEIVIGSRNQENASNTVDSLKECFPGASLRAATNYEAARSADLVVLTVPFAHQETTLKQVADVLDGKILVDVTVPLRPPKVGVVQLPPEGSAGVRAQRILGERVKVVSAFQNVAAGYLASDSNIPCDVLVSGNDEAARCRVIELVEAAGMKGFHAGPIENAAAAEALTSVLININRRLKCHAGIRISGVQ